MTKQEGASPLTLAKKLALAAAVAPPLRNQTKRRPVHVVSASGEVTGVIDVADLTRKVLECADVHFDVDTTKREKEKRCASCGNWFAKAAAPLKRAPLCQACTTLRTCAGVPGCTAIAPKTAIYAYKSRGGKSWRCRSCAGKQRTAKKAEEPCMGTLGFPCPHKAHAPSKEMIQRVRRLGKAYTCRSCASRAAFAALSEGVRAKCNQARIVGAAHLPRPMKGACHRGHVLTADNVYVHPTGARQCRKCQRLRDQARRAKVPPRPRSQVSTCRRGHAITADSVYVNAKGHRKCRQCRALVRAKVPPCRSAT